MFRESSIVLGDSEIIDFQTGNPTTVEFDFHKIWDWVLSHNNNEMHLLNYIHVHPKQMLQCSKLDEGILIGHNIAFGEKFFILFTIVCFESENLYDLSHTAQNYYYDRDKIEIVKKSTSFKLDQHIALSLKLMSYGDTIVSELLTD